MKAMMMMMKMMISMMMMLCRICHAEGLVMVCVCVCLDMHFGVLEFSSGLFALLFMGVTQSLSSVGYINAHTHTPADR